MEDNFQENQVEYEDYRRSSTKKGKENKPKGKFMLFVVIFMAGILAVFASPIFAVKEIIVSDTLYKFKKEEICAMAKISEGNNLLAINKRAGIKALKENSYIESAEILKEFPATVYINIVERKVRGYIPYMGSYLYIDEYGRVLDIKSSFTEPLPVVNGLEFDSFLLNEKIQVKNPEAFDVMVLVAQVMTKYDMLDTVVNIDISDTNKIVARVNGVDVNIGDISNCDEKIRIMAEVIKEIPVDDKGTLDLSDLSKPIVFKYLT